MLCVFLLLFIILSFRKDRVDINYEKPFVSVFVAARNEEKNILRCLEALSQLNYSNLEILIGNDHSEDTTLDIIADFIVDKPHFRVFNIQKNIGLAKGKANVLAQLANAAKGDFFFITDADTKVPKDWINQMLNAFDEKTGVVTGITTLKATTLFQYFQQIDWLYALSLVKSVTDLGFPVTSMGNNMAIRKEAYFETGGYENLPFSITEDFQLFWEVVKNGWHYKNLFHNGTLARSKPTDSFVQLLHQRKRWMIGAMQLPWHFLFLLYIQASFYPLLIILFFICWQGALFVLVLKSFLQMIYIARSYTRLRQKIPTVKLFLFEIYSGFLAISLLLFYFAPFKVIWKGRKY